MRTFDNTTGSLNLKGSPTKQADGGTRGRKHLSFHNSPDAKLFIVRDNSGDLFAAGSGNKDLKEFIVSGRKNVESTGELDLVRMSTHQRSRDNFSEATGMTRHISAHEAIIGTEGPCINVHKAFGRIASNTTFPVAAQLGPLMD